MKNSTLDALARFSQSEKELLKAVLLDADEKLVPREQTINNLLNYSKAVSCRKSEHISDMFFVLN